MDRLIETARRESPAIRKLLKAADSYEYMLKEAMRSSQTADEENIKINIMAIAA